MSARTARCSPDAAPPARRLYGPAARGSDMLGMHHTEAHTEIGDLLEAEGPAGQPSRLGEVVEVLGQPGHQRYRVRWDEQHESILSPEDGVSIIHTTRGQE